MTLSLDRMARVAFPLTAGFLYGAALLRTLLIFDAGAPRTRALVLLGVWLALSAAAVALDRWWQGWFPIYLALQSVVVVMLIAQGEPTDFYAVLLAIPSAQVMQRYPLRIGLAVTAAFIPIMAFPLAETHATGDTAALVFTYSALIALLGSYGLAVWRARAGSDHNLALVNELQLTNRHLEDYSAQLESLAVARERQRLMQDLHDSVTQTVFGMTLTTQAALLTAERDPSRVGPLLDRLAELTRHAQAEMKELVAELRPDAESAGLPTMLHRHILGHGAPEGLAVELEVQGDTRLPAQEELALFRIAQEALNNVAKHSGATEAVIRLRLREPFVMTIEDRGRGFDPGHADHGAGLGLPGMRERAAAIGWEWRAISVPGEGTRIEVVKRTEHDGVQHEQG